MTTEREIFEELEALKRREAARARGAELVEQALRLYGDDSAPPMLNQAGVVSDLREIAAALKPQA